MTKTFASLGFSSFAARSTPDSLLPFTLRTVRLDILHNILDASEQVGDWALNDAAEAELNLRFGV